MATQIDYTPGDGPTGETESCPGIMLDDASILAMCDNGSNKGPREDPPLSLHHQGNITPIPAGFGMEGSTINISHSRDIHFGPRTVAPPRFQSRDFTHGTPSPAPSCDPSGERDYFNDAFSIVAPSISSFHLEDIDRNSFSSVPRREEEEGTSSPVFVSLDSTSESEAPPQQRRTSYQSSSGSSSAASSLKLLRKSVSSPPRDIGSPTSSTLVTTAFQCLPQGARMEVSSPTPAPQMSAAINNSSNVQLGTRIVYNYQYYISDPEQRTTPLPSHTPHSSTASLAESLNAAVNRASVEGSSDYLMEFKEKLISFYQKRARCSPLPWHRGKQLIPINEYYTEPQILAVDKVGKRTSEMVDIISLLNSRNEMRFLVEGEAGMGKTLLATKLAEEWANGVQLQQFQILLFVTLGDFKGSLQQYVTEELLPSYFKTENFEKVWEYCKTHDREILFVLDGYEELKREDKGEIQNLLRSKDFPESKVVVTSRPNFLQDWEMKIVVNGFGQLQIMEFIEKYFRAIGNDSCGESLRKIIEKDEKYWKLAKRPLFCVLMCMLYITGDVGESLPDRQSDVMLQIILCLIKWNRKNSANVSIDFDSLPQEYEKPFLNFGKLCLDALKNEKSRFSDQDVKRVEGFGSKLEQLGFLYTDDESHALGEKRYWKPVHQTFLEYLGAFYMAKHIRDCKNCKECKEYGLVFQRSQEVLKFCIGILNNKAYRILDGQRFPFLWKLSVTRILRLLKEAEPKSENFQAIAKLLDQNMVEISTSEIEFEGWSYILSQPFRRLRSLKIAWRIKSKSPDQESSFTEASEVQYQNFFEALRNNESIESIHVRAKQDGEPFTEEKISMFFSHLQTALLKKNLHELHIVEMKMKASSYLRRIFEVIANQSSRVRALHDLQVLKLHTFMEDQDLRGICDALRKCTPSLETLHLEGLEHGQAGFSSLVKLLKGNSSIKNLHISMNQSLFVNAFGSCENSSEDYPPKEMGMEYKKLNRTAGRRSMHAFTEHLNAQQTENDESCSKSERESNREWEPDPRKELAFLFEKIPLNNGQWSLEARHHWFLRKASSDFRIPLPVCVHREHKSVFHFLFKELPKTHVKSLTLGQAGLYLTTADLICLGDAVRTASHLTSLDLQCLEKVEKYLPLLIGMGQSPALASVNLFSSKVTLHDAAYEVVCAALQNNTSLRKLSLGKWQFHLQNTKEALDRLKKVLDTWQVDYLDLKQCVIELGSNIGSLSQPKTPSSPCSQPLNAFFSLPFEPFSQPWKSLKSISLEGVELKEQTGLVRRAHLLLSGLTNFTNLTSLDLSMSQAKSVQVDNIAVRRFFGLIGSKMKHLQELKLGYWEFCLQSKENGNDISSSLHSCRKLRTVQLERVNEIVSEYSLHKNENSSSWCKLTFLHQLVSSTPYLEEVSLCYYKINGSLPDQDLAVRLSQCLHDHWHHLPFTVKFFNLRSEIDDAIYNTLKRPPYFVKRASGPSPIRTFKVRSVINLMKKLQ